MTTPAYQDGALPAAGSIRTVLGDLTELPAGTFYPHEHLMLHSPLIAAAFPHVLLDDVAAAEAEVRECLPLGVAAIVDAMPMSCGRDVLGLAEVSRRTGAPVLASTGLHHDRYYGPRHWTNHVDVDRLAELMVDDLTVGIDEFDYTSPVVRRTGHRAGLIKLATSGAHLDDRDVRNLRAAGAASAATGCPILTHCEGGFGAVAQLKYLAAEGVPASSVVLSHPDKTGDLGYLAELAAAGAVLEMDQVLRQRALGVDGVSIRLVAALVEAGYARQVVIGADAARRTLWHTHGGEPGLVWVARELPALLAEVGLTDAQIYLVTRDNAERAYRWREVEAIRRQAPRPDGRRPDTACGGSRSRARASDGSER